MFYTLHMLKKTSYFLILLIIAGCSPESDFEKYKDHVKTLASDEFEGRAPGTPGGEKTKSYISNHFESLGLKSFGDSYLMPVTLTAITLDESKSSFNLAVDGEVMNIAYRSDVVYGTTRQLDNVSIENSDLVFVGYGVNAPEYGWNDYKVDVKGKTVVMLINDPGFELQSTEFNGRAMTYYGRWTYKFEEAARQGAAGVLIIHETAPASYPWGVVENGWSGEQLNLTFKDKNIGRSALEGWITLDVAEKLFAKMNTSYDEMKSIALSKNFQPIPMDGMTLSSNMVNALRETDSHNVVGYVEGSEAPEEFVLIMGHWDHMGVDTSIEGDQIYNGAVDNATGTAAVMHIAETFSKKSPKRSIAFIGLTAEESGLLGSAYMVEYPPFEYKNVIGGLNLDAFPAFGKAKDITIVGYGASEILNFNRVPEINLNTGRDAVITPVVANGRIVDVSVSYGGTDYNSPPDLVVLGIGSDAKLVPEMNSSGNIVSVNIQSGGIGYGVSTTFVRIDPAGSGFKSKPSLQRWTINEFKKNLSNLNDDDVFISNPLNSEYGLQCSYTYAPRNLRKISYASDADGHNACYAGADDYHANADADIADEADAADTDAGVADDVEILTEYQGLDQHDQQPTRG